MVNRNLLKVEQERNINYGKHVYNQKSHKNIMTSGINLNSLTIMTVIFQYETKGR